MLFRSLSDIARPWIYSKILPDAGDPIFSHVIGTQLFNTGKVQEARSKLEEAYRRKPGSAEFALNLARLYMILKEYDKVEPLLFPLLSQPKPQFEVFFLIGKAFQGSGKLDKAIDIFNKAISHFGLSTHILNAIGECYFQLGVPDEALMAWEKSLEVDPNQPQIKTNIEALKRKK